MKGIKEIKEEPKEEEEILEPKVEKRSIVIDGFTLTIVLENT